MAITERDLFESRLARIEASLHALERRVGALDHQAPSHELAVLAPETVLVPDAAPIVQAGPALEEPSEAPLIDFTLIGKSILIVGGAYLLRALTELHVLPQLGGMVLALLYAISWMVIADRALARGQQTAAAFDAATGAMIAGGLIWEATTRFNALNAIAATALTLCIATGLLVVSIRRGSDALARVAAVLTVLTLTGLAVGTADLVPPALGAAAVGVTAFRLRRDLYTTSILAVASDFLGLALVVMTAVSQTPHAQLTVEIALVAIAAAWLFGNDVQAAFALVIGLGGASFFAFGAAGGAIVWGAAAVGAAFLARRMPAFTYFVPLWSISAVVAALVGGSHASILLATGAPLLAAAWCSAALVLMPSYAVRPRVFTLGAVALGVLAALQSGFGLNAMERSVVLAAVAILLALPRRPEFTTLARFTLILGAVKLLAEDLRGPATMIVIALVAYGVAMLVVARRRTAMRLP
jgi:hypothetical protein